MAQRDTEQRLAAFDASIYRNRHIYGPPAVAGAVLGISWLGHWIGWHWWYLLPVGIALVAGLDHATSLPRGRERWFACSTWIGMCTWSIAVTIYGLRAWLLITLGIGFTAFMPPWIRHRRIRRGVSVDKAIEAWGDGSAVGLPGTKTRGTDAGQGWYSFKVVAKEVGHYTIANYTAQKARIAARAGVRAVDVTFTPGANEGEVIVTIRDEPKAVVQVELTTTARSIVGEHRIGSTDSGEPIMIALNLPGRGAQHGAAVGATGSGKSSLANGIGKIVAESEDGLLWMVDMSYGARELRGWAPACDWFAYTKEHVDDMLEVLRLFAEARGSDKGRVHTPSPQSPQIVVIIDESASVWSPELLGADAEIRDVIQAKRVAAERGQRFAELLRLLRKYGVSVFELTQYGVNEALGGATAKQQLASGYSAVFYSAKNTDGHVLIPAGRGVQCAEFPQTKPGTLGIKGPTIEGVVQGRVDYVTDEARDSTVDYWRDKQPTVEPKLIAAGGDLYARRNRTAPPADGDEGDNSGDTVSPGPGTPVPEAPAAVPRRMSPEESRQHILDTLVRLGVAGPSQIAEAAQKSITMTKARLGELAEAGLVEQAGKGHRGKWRAVSTGDRERPVRGL